MAHSIDNGGRPLRKAGLRGALPPLPPGERFPLRYLHEYAAQPLPAPTYPVDVTGGIPADGWQMLGNGPDPSVAPGFEGVGDCPFAGRQHYRMAKAAVRGETETWETAAALVQEYLKYDHGKDKGAVLAKVLLAWYRAGLILAFAPVDHSDPLQVDSAMEQFCGLYCGVQLTPDADQLFAQRLPWTIAGGQQPDPDLGHCVVKVKADGTGLDGYVTWGALQAATRAWSGACVVECWVIITSEDEAAKVNMAALCADIDALGGTGGIVPETGEADG